MAYTLSIVCDCTEELEFNRSLKILDAVIIVSFLVREARDVVNLILNL
jgi:hypothetical protein